MALEGVPWMVSGGEHSAEVGRMLAYAATGGGEGVVAPEDLKVVASAIPDGNIHIWSGGLVALNRYPGGGQQSYIIRNIDDTVVALDPQGSSGDRYDLVAILVEDPQYPGQPAPATVEDGPYVRAVVYKDVGPTANTLAEVDPDQTGYVLARVKFNASDGTITDADITDLRDLVQPRNKVETHQRFPAPGEYTGVVTQWVTMFTGHPAVTVPEWATRMTVIIHVDGLASQDHHTGEWRADFGPIVGTAVAYDVDTGPGDFGGRFNYRFGLFNVDVSALQGETHEVLPKGRRTYLYGGAYPYFSAVVGTSVTYEIRFEEGLV